MIDLEQFNSFIDRYGLRQTVPAGSCRPGQSELEITTAKESLCDELSRRRFRKEIQPEQPAAVLLLGGKGISTPGNLTVISAQAKDGKSAAVSAMMAAALNPSAADIHRLGFRAAAHQGRAIVHIDTEQSAYDHYRLCKRTLRRAGIEDTPEIFRSYMLADIDAHQRIQLFELSLEIASQEFGGVFAAFIDGVGDLVTDPNDGPEAFSLVGGLHRLSIHYHCPIVCVLHENPGSAYGKTRGHLGSQLERKAETNLRLAKDPSGRTTMWVERGRSCHIPKSEGLQFEYSDDYGMHIQVEGICEGGKRIRQKNFEKCARDVFAGGGDHLSWRNTIDRIVEVSNVPRKTAEKHLTEMRDLGVIEKLPEGGYRLGGDLSNAQHPITPASPSQEFHPLAPPPYRGGRGGGGEKGEKLHQEQESNHHTTERVCPLALRVPVYSGETSPANRPSTTAEESGVREIQAESGAKWLKQPKTMKIP